MSKDTVHSVYVVTNLVNGKKYVGQTSKPVSTRWSSHLGDARRGVVHPLHRAIRKYGLEKFSVQLIHECSKHEIALAERRFVAELGTKAPNGYNLTDGGEGRSGYKLSEISRQKIAKAAKRQWQDPNIRSKMGRSEEGKVRFMLAIKKRADSGAYHTDEALLKMSTKAKERLATAEARLERSRSMKQAWADPDVRTQWCAAAKLRCSAPEGKRQLLEAVASRLSRVPTPEQRAARASLTKLRARTKTGQLAPGKITR